MAADKLINNVMVQVKPFLESTTPELLLRVTVEGGKTYTARELFPANDFEAVFDRVAARAFNRIKAEMLKESL